MGWGKVPKAIDLPDGSQTGRNGNLETIPFDEHLEKEVQNSVKEGRALGDKEKGYVYDKIDYYKSLADRCQLDSNTEKILSLFECSYWTVDSEELKKCLDYKNRDGSPIDKGKQEYAYSETILILGETLRDYAKKTGNADYQRTVDDMCSIGRIIYNTDKENMAGRPNPSELFDEIVERMHDNDLPEHERGRGQ